MRAGRRGRRNQQMYRHFGLSISLRYRGRDFMYAALRQFDYEQSFIRLNRRSHSETTAMFVVYGDNSSTFPVRSAIRQGCRSHLSSFCWWRRYWDSHYSRTPFLGVRPYPGCLVGLTSFPPSWMTPLYFSRRLTNLPALSRSFEPLVICPGCGCN